MIKRSSSSLLYAKQQLLQFTKTPSVAASAHQLTRCERTSTCPCCAHQRRPFSFHTTKFQEAATTSTPEAKAQEYVSINTGRTQEIFAKIAANEENMKLNKKAGLVFTCTVCQTQQFKMFSKHSYDHGVVIIRCDGCDNNHLIADRLGWFSDKAIGIEDIMREKGVEVRKANIAQFAELLNNEEAASSPSEDATQTKPTTPSEKQ